MVVFGDGVKQGSHLLRSSKQSLHLLTMWNLCQKMGFASGKTVWCKTKVNATHSTCSWSVELREQVIPREWSHTRGGVCDPKNCKRREIALEGRMSRDGIRQILAGRFLKKLA